MNDNDGKNAENLALEAIRGMGIQAEPLPRCSTKTADLILTHHPHRTLVEVSLRAADGFLADLGERARHDQIAVADRPVGTPAERNRLDAKLRRKARQLRETQQEVEADFLVCWICAHHDDWDHTYTLLVRQLYGMVPLRVWSDEAPDPRPAECLYWNHFTFFRERDLTAVVLDSGFGGLIFLNSLSGRADDFRGTEFYNRFSDAARLDPEVAMQRGCLSVDLDVDRSTPGAQHMHIRKKYGLWASEIVMAEMRAAAYLPRE